MRGHTSKRKNNVIFSFWSSVVPSRKRVPNRKHIGEMQVHDCNKKSAPISSRSVQISSRSDVTTYVRPAHVTTYVRATDATKCCPLKAQLEKINRIRQISWIRSVGSGADFSWLDHGWISQIQPGSSIFAKQRGKSFPLWVFNFEHVFSRVLRLTKITK